MMYHGSLVERNGIDLAIEALERVRQVLPNAELRIFGPHTPFLDRPEHVVLLAFQIRSLRYDGARLPGLSSQPFGEPPLFFTSR